MRKNMSISISISKKLLAKIEREIKGKNRSEKLVKCIRKGYEILISKK